jgi:hypothetical protein
MFAASSSAASRDRPAVLQAQSKINGYGRSGRGAPLKL